MSVTQAVAHRVLIVDDNPDIHQDIRKVLLARPISEKLDEIESLMFGQPDTGNGVTPFELASAFQGQDALKQVIQAARDDQAFDLAIVDMRMPPGWDGIETIERLWAQDPDLHVILCTAFSDHSWDEVFERLGLQDKLLILKKPFDDCELLQAARALCKKRWLLFQGRGSLDLLQHQVTQRNRELESLHLESESLLDALSAGLVAFDAFGFVTRWNGAAEKLFGIPAQESISKLVMELELPWQCPELFADFFQTNQYLKNKRLELTLNGPSGEILTVEVSLHPVSLNGLPVGGLMLVDDITNRRRLELQLNQAQKLEAVGQLAAGIAHEINTPMQYVGDNVQFLRASVLKLDPTLRLLNQVAASTEARDSLAVVDQIRQSLRPLKLNAVLDQLPKSIQDVEQGIENVVRIVQAMKELSHPGTDAPTSLDIHRILESAIVVSRSEWRNIAEVERNFTSNPPGMLGFANQLQQVFLNLIVNATHAIETRKKSDSSLSGRIRITTVPLMNRFLITIQDNGCGIPESIRNRVYDPFFTTKDVGKGTGQGLAIAHQMIGKNHQGRLWFESEVNLGTTFYIELPTADNQAII